MAMSSGPSVRCRAALGENALGRNRAHAGAQHQPGWNLRLLRRLGTRLAHGLVQQILEHRPRPLEAVGADVGQVVGNDVQVGLLGVEAGLGNPERTDHGLIVAFCLPGNPLIWGGDGMDESIIWESGAARSLASADDSTFICISNWRASEIMVTICSAAFTLLPSI
jgi:hypothetical protein